jgi:hypothetical protein
MSRVVSLARVRTLLAAVPVDGLRRAAAALGVDVPATAQHRDVAAALEHYYLEPTPALPPLSVPTDVMWAACVAASLPPLLGSELRALAAATWKVRVAVRVTVLVDALGGTDALATVCAGKASATTRHAEKTALTKRWRGRYRTYSGMCRLYADVGGGGEHKERERFALDVEEHAFAVLRQLFAAAARPEAVAFSAEPGRMTRDYAPQWGVFVYLAYKKRESD